MSEKIPWIIVGVCMTALLLILCFPLREVLTKYLVQELVTWLQQLDAMYIAGAIITLLIAPWSLSIMKVWGMTSKRK